MNTNYETTNQMICEMNHEVAHDVTAEVLADHELTSALGLLAASEIGAEVVYTGDADGCPHCALRVLSAAA